MHRPKYRPKPAWVVALWVLLGCAKSHWPQQASDEASGETAQEDGGPAPAAASAEHAAAQTDMPQPNAEQPAVMAAVVPESPAPGDRAAGSDGRLGAQPPQAGMGVSGSAPAPINQGCLEPSQVVALGDSFVSVPADLVPRIEQRAVAAGALAQDQHYVDLSAAGASLDRPPGMGAIPAQWQTAKASSTQIEVVIMDGGGIDFLRGPEACFTEGAIDDQECLALVDQVLEATRSLLLDIRASGVSDVVYFQYPDVPRSMAVTLHDRIVTRSAALCAELSDDAFVCHFVDARPIFAGHPEYFLDVTHPNDAGAEALAEQLWQTMKDACLAQARSSGCCGP